MQEERGERVEVKYDIAEGAAVQPHFADPAGAAVQKSQSGMQGGPVELCGLHVIGSVSDAVKSYIFLTPSPAEVLQGGGGVPVPGGVSWFSGGLVSVRD